MFPVKYHCAFKASYHEGRYQVNKQAYYKASYGATNNIPSSQLKKKRFTNDELEDIFGKKDPAEIEKFMKKNPVVRKPYEEKPEVKNLSEGDVKKWRDSHEMEIIGTGCPKPVLQFEHAPFIPEALRTLKACFVSPSPIQSQGWSLALNGNDLVASAQTGSGKTLAFIIPGLEHVFARGLAGQPCRAGPAVVVLVPTRELAIQIAEESSRFLHCYSVEAACLFGGSGNRQEQSKALFRGPHVVIATPGRLLDFVNSGAVRLTNASYVVIDEADRMLDMGFEPQVRSVMDLVRKDRQTLMWSATWPKRVQALGESFLSNPIRIKIGADEVSANKDVKQEFVFCNNADRIIKLLEILKNNDKEKILIFSQTKSDADIIAEELGMERMRVRALHGDKSQTERNEIMRAFKSNRIRILVATDIAARGLDISDVTLVINYAMPMCAEDYVHRIGRTGRAGRTGKAISLFTRDDIALTKDIITLLESSNQSVPQELRKLASVKIPNSMMKRNAPVARAAIRPRRDETGSHPGFHGVTEYRRDVKPRQIWTKYNTKEEFDISKYPKNGMYKTVSTFMPRPKDAILTFGNNHGEYPDTDDYDYEEEW